MEPTRRVVVDVTFLEMRHPSGEQAQPLPAGWSIELEKSPTVPLYRMLHDRIGRDYCWWMRQARSDADLKAILDQPERSLFLLKEGEDIRGFCEFEKRPYKTINLAYFGLMPEMIGRGIGRIFLSHALSLAWLLRPQRVTVNTCTADHPRALPGYLKAGFRIVGVVRENWDVPLRLELPAPKYLGRFVD